MSNVSEANSSANTFEVTPEASLEVLSKSEVALLVDSDDAVLQERFRKIALAVLNCGAGDTVHGDQDLHQRYPDFDVKVLATARGIKLRLSNVPQVALVDGKMIRGLRQLLFAALRDVLYVRTELERHPDFDLSQSAGITDAVFHMLRNANALGESSHKQVVVCWGGHSISGAEYDYAKRVGYHLGLRGFDICTGCGAGAMKAPMKGANLAHAKQRIRNPRYIGLTEPGIIASEAPNAIVNELVILPDIEKRLEAFVRIAYGIVIFPGGVGTAEELLYLLGVLLDPENKHIPLPLVLTAPASSAAYFEQIDALVGQVLGAEAQAKYQIIIDDEEAAARAIREGAEQAQAFREQQGDAFYFNWLLKIAADFQQPFAPTHENMAKLNLNANQPAHLLAADLRRAFSGIVAGNVKDEGLAAIAKHGVYQLNGDAALMQRLDKLLQTFVEQGRMNTQGSYTPCYRLIQ